MAQQSRAMIRSAWSSLTSSFMGGPWRRSGSEESGHGPEEDGQEKQDDPNEHDEGPKGILGFGAGIGLPQAHVEHDVPDDDADDPAWGHGELPFRNSMETVQIID